VKIVSPDGSILMEIAGVSLADERIVVTGKIMGAMPMKAVIQPSDLRSLLWRIGPRTVVRIAWTVLTERTKAV
jgi:hypothetical protein